jgi:hypothetical protein
VGVEREVLSAKVDKPCIQFLDWLAKQTGATRSIATNNLVWAVMRALMQGDIGLPAIALQGLHRNGLSTELPLCEGGIEPGLKSLPPNGIPHQARFNFLSRLRASRRLDAAVVGLVALHPSFRGFRLSTCGESSTGRAA